MNVDQQERLLTELLEVLPDREGPDEVITEMVALRHLADPEEGYRPQYAMAAEIDPQTRILTGRKFNAKYLFQVKVALKENKYLRTVDPSRVPYARLRQLVHPAAATLFVLGPPDEWEESLTGIEDPEVRSIVQKDLAEVLLSVLKKCDDSEVRQATLRKLGRFAPERSTDQSFPVSLE